MFTLLSCLRVFVQLGSILANMFYQTCATNMISKGDRANPLHLIIMSVGMIALQAYMNPRTLTDIALIQVPEAPVEQQVCNGYRHI